MNDDKLICLGMFTEHSCYSWGWIPNENVYYRECSLFGCSFSETTKDLVSEGKETVVENVKHTHSWAKWRSTADQFGEYIPPWTYKRVCHSCGAVNMVESLKILQE